MYNKVTLVGRVGKKPEIKDGSKGNKFCRFTIACNSYQNGKENTQWFNVICFGKSAESCCQYVDKGSLVLVEGKIQIDEFEKDGVKHNTISVLSDRIIFLSTKGNHGQDNQTSQQPVQVQESAFGDSDVVEDIPF
jgi:single-strand DNA-binding protein